LDGQGRPRVPSRSRPPPVPAWCAGSGPRLPTDVRVVKTHGELVWPSHPDTDELFLVLAGSLTIRTEAGDLTLGPGQLHVVPREVRHQPSSAGGADVVLIEPSRTVNTGDTPSHLTAARRTLDD